MSDKQTITFTIEEAKEIGEVVGIDFNNIDIEEFKMGLTIELEHGKIDEETNITDDDLYMTAKIAWAHLKEIPNYYTKLKKVEALRQNKVAENKQADTTLFNNPWITVRQDNKGYVYANVPEGVAILPYKIEDGKTLYMLRSEQNSVLAPEGSLITVITGRRDDEDKEEPWYIQTAIRELEEEAGIVLPEKSMGVDDTGRITLLGEMSTNKHTKQSDILLAIDVTGLEENEPETDGTEDEAHSYNFWVDEKGLREFIRSSKDSYLSTITNKFFNKDTNLSIVNMGRI